MVSGPFIGGSSECWRLLVLGGITGRGGGGLGGGDLGVSLSISKQDRHKVPCVIFNQSISKMTVICDT